MPYVGGSNEAIQLLTELEVGGRLVRLNSRDWLNKINAANTPPVKPFINDGDLILVHLSPLGKSVSDRFVKIYPPLSLAVGAKRCVFLVFNLSLKRVLCIGVEGCDVFVLDPSEGIFHSTLQDVDEVGAFLQTDVLNQVQHLVDGLSEYVQALGEYKLIFRFAEDEVFAALENTSDESDASLVEIEGESLTRGELINYDKAISANALRMNIASRKIELFFPDFDFSDLNSDEY